jgi:hypothetical protein
MKILSPPRLDLLAACLGVAALALQACTSADPPREATAPDPASREQIIQTVASPQGDRQAQLIRRLGNFLIRSGEMDGPEFDEIMNLRFTPDGRSLLYEGRRGENWFAVVDGREWALRTQVVHGSLRLSPDRQRLALVGHHGDKWQVMVDGRPQGPFDFIFADSLSFSADSRRVGYLAVLNNRVVAVVNGQIVRHFEVLKEAGKALKDHLEAAGGKD